VFVCALCFGRSGLPDELRLVGHLRGYSAEDGKVVWDYDTSHEFRSVNGVKASGGSIDGPGAVVVNGMVFISSGYSRFGGMPLRTRC